jgi:hypothetical protein
MEATMLVKVLESVGSRGAFMAEVPGQRGRYVKARSLADLKVELRAAMADPTGARFAEETWSTPGTGCSETSLFVAL